MTYSRWTLGGGGIIESSLDRVLRRSLEGGITSSADGGTWGSSDGGKEACHWSRHLTTCTVNSLPRKDKSQSRCLITTVYMKAHTPTSKPTSWMNFLIVVSSSEALVVVVLTWSLAVSSCALSDGTSAAASPSELPPKSPHPRNTPLPIWSSPLQHHLDGMLILTTKNPSMRIQEFAYP